MNKWRVKKDDHVNEKEGMNESEGEKTNKIQRKNE